MVAQLGNHSQWPAGDCATFPQSPMVGSAPRQGACSRTVHTSWQAVPSAQLPDGRGTADAGIHIDTKQGFVIALA